MLPRYSPIPDSDTEKQPLVDQPVCHCQYQHQEQRQRGPSKSSFFLFSLILLLVLGYGHHQQQLRQDPILSSSTNGLQQSMDISWTTTNYCSDSSTFVPWAGKSVYNLDKNFTGLSVEEKYHGRTYNPMHGTVVVIENKNLKTPKVTFDIKVENDDYQDVIRIDEVVAENTLGLTVQHESNVRGVCVQVNVKVEVPSSSSLGDLSLQFPSSDISVDTQLQLKNLNLGVASGDITISRPLSATKIHLAAASGDINGVFNVEQVDFNASAASGNVDVVFEHVSAVSTITASTASGNVGVQLPSDFETKLDLDVVVGKISVNAADAEKLHYRQSGGIVGKNIRGYYGDDAETPSKIKLSSVSGNLRLGFQ